MNCLAHQQTDLVIAALVLGGCLALSRSRGWLAATAFGLAAALKCTPLLWSPYLLWRGRWKEAAWLVVVAVGVNLLPNLLSAPAPGRLYLTDWVTRFLLPMNRPDYYPGTWYSAPIYNQSLPGTISRWVLTEPRWAADEGVVPRPHPLPVRTVKLLVVGSQVLLVAALWLVLRRRPWPEAVSLSGCPPVETAAEYSIVILLMLLLSPMSNTQHFIPLVLPSFCLARLAVAQRQRTPALLLLACLAVRGTVIKWLWGEEFSSWCLWAGSVTWSAGFLLLGCAWVLLRRRRIAVLPLEEETLALPAPRSRSA